LLNIPLRRSDRKRRLTPDYELRRELIRAGKTPGIRRLDAVRAGFDPLTQDALDNAAVLLAAVQNSGMATAHPAALDGDAILAAQTILAAVAGDIVTIATNNARHLSRFRGSTRDHGSRPGLDRLPEPIEQVVFFQGRQGFVSR
jgi:hypothetical protein